jgi:hypothetical protein
MKRSYNPDIFEAYATPEEKRWDRISEAHKENRCIEGCPICEENARKMMFSTDELSRLNDILRSARKPDICKNKRHGIELLRICSACDRVLCGNCAPRGCQCENDE